MQMFNLTIKLIIDENDKYFCDSHIEPQMYFEALKQKRNQPMMNALDMYQYYPWVVKKK